MNDSNWIEVVAAIGSLMSGIGLFAAAASLVYLARQTRASERATTASVYQSIVAMGNSINDMFLDRPELYEQIFGVASVPADFNVDNFPSKNPQCFFAAQKWLDYFELILIMWEAIPKGLHDPWREYILSNFENSPLLRQMVLKNKWYGDDLRKLCEAVNESQEALSESLDTAESPSRSTLAS